MQKKIEKWGFISSDAFVTAISPKNIVFTAHIITLSVFFSIFNSYIYLGETIFFDFFTYIICLIFIFVLFSIIFYFRKLYSPHIDYMMVVIYIYFLPRLCQYLIAPEFVLPPFLDMTVQEVNFGLSSFIPLFVIFVAGIAVAEKAIPSTRSIEADSRFPKFSEWYLFAAFLIFSLFELVVYGDPNNSIYAMDLLEKASTPKPLVVLMTIASSDVFLLALMFWYLDLFTRPQACTRAIIVPTILVMLTITSFAIISTMTGSRSGGIRIIMLSAVLFFSLRKSWPLLKATILVAIVGAILTYALYPASQAARLKYVAPEQASAQTKSISQGNSEEKGALYWVFNRLGYADYIIVTLAREPAQECSDYYLNWPYYLKNTANFLLPGDPFEEAQLSSSNTFGRCYRAATTSFYKHYISEVWSLTGLSKIMYGGFSPLICLLAGLTFGLLTQAVHGLPGVMGRIAFAYWAYLFPFLTIFSMGVDHSLNTYITAGLRLIFLFGVLLLPLLFAQFRQRPT